MITLSSTIVRHLLKSGDVKDYCPFQVKKLMDGEYELSGEAIQFGLFFETIAIGKGLKGKQVTDLPRKKNGEKRVTQLRIESQAEKFKELCVKYGIIITEENTQVTIKKKLSEGVFLQGNLDICPATILHPKYGKILTVIDLKLTKSLENEWGDYAWKTPHLMDLIQSEIYLYLIEDLDLSLNEHLPEIFEIVKRRGKETIFIYWIFEHFRKGGEPLRNKMIPIYRDSLKRLEMLESLRKAYLLIKYHEKNGWDKRKGDNCSQCPVTECEFYPKNH